jgi:leader peptidase (prepilin peptidase)/N-methyltransferase
VALHLAVYAGAAAVWPPVWPWGAVAALFIWISVTDIERLEIPDAASALLVLTGAVRLWAVPGLPLADHLMGAVLWPLLVWGVAVGYARLRGWQGLGLGDVKLMAGIGLWLGFGSTTIVLLAAALAGILTLVAAGLRQKVPFAALGTSAVAFGPFLCLSAWVVWLQGLS